MVFLVHQYELEWVIAFDLVLYNRNENEYITRNYNVLAPPGPVLRTGSWRGLPG